MKPFIAAFGAVFLFACSDLTPAQREAVFEEGLFIANALTDGKMSIDGLTDNQRLAFGSLCRLGPAFSPDAYAVAEPFCNQLEAEK